MSYDIIEISIPLLSFWSYTFLIVSFLLSRYDSPSTSNQDKKNKDDNKEKLSEVSDNHLGNSCNQGQSYVGFSSVENLGLNQTVTNIVSNKSILVFLTNIIINYNICNDVMIITIIDLLPKNSASVSACDLLFQFQTVLSFWFYIDAYRFGVSGLWEGCYHHCHGKGEFKLDKAPWMI